MKKYTKYGHLQGNTSVPEVASPLLQGTIPMDVAGNITLIDSLPTPWNLSLYLETEVKVIEVDFSDSTTGASLQNIVDAINNDPDNSYNGTQQLTASIRAGCLRIESVSTGDGAFLRVNAAPPNSFPSSAIYFGLREHPHSEATVYSGDLTSSAVDSLGQKNPMGTSFIARGEDRSSDNYNRALASIGINADTNRMMLSRGLGVPETLQLEIDVLDPSFIHPRFIVDPLTNAVNGISLDSNIANDPHNTLLENRILVGTLTKDSTISEIRELFNITDPEGKEISFNGKPVRVSAITSGYTQSYLPPTGPLVMESKPMANLNLSQVVGDVGIALSADIPRDSGTQSQSITEVLDGYTVVCDTATFITGNVSPGDKVVISGSSGGNRTNDGNYLVENVISETTLELKPIRFESVTSLVKTATGSISVSTGGMWIKSPTLWLTEPIQLPLNHDVYVSLPIEKLTGDLPEDALLKSSAIDVPFWVTQQLYFGKSLDGAYKGTAQGRKGSGYFISADSKPIEIQTEITPDRLQGSIRSISSVSILANNVLKLDLTTTDAFFGDDVGRIVSFTSPTPTAITDSVLLPKEMVVITKLLDSKTVEVRKTSRNTTDLPIGAVSGITIYEDDFHPFLQNSINIVNYDGKPTGVGGIDDSASMGDHSPNTLNSNLRLVRISKLRWNKSDNPIQAITTSTSSQQVSTVAFATADEDYLRGIYSSSGLFVRIYNGTNAGFYPVTHMTHSASLVLTVINMDGTPLVFNAESVDQFGALYRPEEGSSVILGTNNGNMVLANKVLSSVQNYGQDSATALQISWKGEGSGITLNTGSNSNWQRGISSSGPNIDIYANPGTSGVSVYNYGFADFDPASLDANAELSLSLQDGRGKFAFQSSSYTYNYTGDGSTTVYHSGGAFFQAHTDDPSLVLTGDVTTFPLHAFSTTRLAVQSSSGSEVGSSNEAATFVGDIGVYAKENRDSSSRASVSIHTEANIGVIGFNSNYLQVPSSTSLKPDVLAFQRGVVGRFMSTTTGSVRAYLLNEDLSIFSSPHLCILKVETGTIFSNSSKYKPMFIGGDASHLIGSVVFLVNSTTLSPSGTTSTSFADVANSNGGFTSGSIPFKLGSDAEIQGLTRGLKVVAVVKQSAPVYLMALEKVDSTHSVTITDETSLISGILWKPPVTGNQDIETWVEIGKKTGQAIVSRVYASNEYFGNTYQPIMYSGSDGASFDFQQDSQGSTSKSKSMASYDSSTSSGLEETDSVFTKNIYDLTVWGPTYFRPTQEIPIEVGSPAFKTEGSLDKGFTLADNNSDITISHTYSSTRMWDIVGSDGVYVTSGYYPGVKLNYFRGGGRKLVLHSSPWKSSVQNVAFTLRKKIDKKLLVSASSIELEIVAAHFYVGTKTMTVNIKDADTNVVLASSSSPIYGFNPPNIDSRKFVKVTFGFSTHTLASCANETEFENKNLIAEISVTVIGGFTNHPSVANLSSARKNALARGIGTKFVTSDEDTAVFSGDFPDAVLIKSITIKDVVKPVKISSAFEAQGMVRANAFRLRNPVLGHEIVTPAKVDLLQNSEYGNGFGNWLPLHDQDVYSSNRSNRADDINLEGSDVGLLPLWKVVPPYWGIEDDNPVVNVGEYNLDGSQIQGQTGVRLTSESVNWEDSLGDYPTGVSTVYYVTVNQSLAIKNNIFAGFTDTTSTSYNYNSGFYLSKQSYDINDGSSELNIYTIQVNVDYVVSFVQFYRPTFDRAAFFRKGAHAAAIHAYHPYFDPMFYWENAAMGVLRGRLDNLPSFLQESESSVSPPSSGQKYDAGSYRTKLGKGYVKLLDSRVAPDALKLPGKTGFVVPLDPPHGSLLKNIRLKLSIRPNISRIAQGSTEFGGNFYGTFGIWHGLPTRNDTSTPVEYETGAYWMTSSNWMDREGYTVKVWRHSPFEEGIDFGDRKENFNTGILGAIPPNQFTSENKRMNGNATLIYQQDVSIRSTKTESKNGKCGSPYDYTDFDTGVLHEAISDLVIDLPDNENVLVDREHFGYFVTIEFYCGIRKARNNVFPEGAEGEYITDSVPGLSPDIDQFNQDHFPFMWTPAPSHVRPTGVGTIYGNDKASIWEGFWVPHGKLGASREYPQTIYRRHPFNEYTLEDSDISSSTTDAQLAATIDTSKYPKQFPQFQTIAGDYPATTQEIQLNDHLNLLQERSSQVANHQLWYPVIKFRGLRLTYQMERPGHGGWGG